MQRVQHAASANQFELTFTPIWQKPQSEQSAPASTSSMMTQVGYESPLNYAGQKGQSNDGGVAMLDRLAGQYREASSPAERAQVGSQVSYLDRDLDRKLALNADKVVHLTDVPNDVLVKYWADKNGFFLYFQNGSDSEAPHHINSAARQISINHGPLINLDDKRVRVSNMTLVHDLKQTQHLPAHMQSFGYGSLSRDGEGSDTKAYFSRLTRLSFQALDFQEKLLGPAADKSTNPYIRMSLSDIYVAKVLKPVVDAVLNGGTLNFNDPQILPNLQKAYQLNEFSKIDALGSLKDMHQLPQMNTVLPWAPFDVDQLGRYSYGFYTGAYDQAYVRNLAIKEMINLIKLGGKPQLDINSLLPPDQFAPHGH